MFESLINVEKRYNELSELMADQQIASDYEQMARLAKERSDLQEMVETFHHYQTVQRELDDSTLLLHDADQDPELQEMAREEVTRLEAEVQTLEQTLRLLLLPSDPTRLQKRHRRDSSWHWRRRGRFVCGRSLSHVFALGRGSAV